MGGGVTAPVAVKDSASATAVAPHLKRSAAPVSESYRHQVFPGHIHIHYLSSRPPVSEEQTQAQYPALQKLKHYSTDIFILYLAHLVNHPINPPLTSTNNNYFVAVIS